MIRVEGFHESSFYEINAKLENYIQKKSILPENIISISHSVSKHGYTDWYNIILVYNEQ